MQTTQQQDHPHSAQNGVFVMAAHCSCCQCIVLAAIGVAVAKKALADV
jgi:hypothetical protein